MTNRKLEIKYLGESFTNNFGFPSRKITFYDSVSELTCSIFIHQRHAGHFCIWSMIEKEGKNTKLNGVIKRIEINETLIRSVDTYKNTKIIRYEPFGEFVIIDFSDLNELGNLQLALRNQLYKYVVAHGQLFDPNELSDEKYLRNN
jgi:hypothetical protein